MSLLGGEAEKSCLMWTTHRDTTHYDLLNCTNNTETESSEHTLINVYTNGSCTTHRTQCEKRINKNTKHNTGIPSHIHSDIFSIHTPTCGQKEREGEREREKNTSELSDTHSSNNTGNDGWCTHTTLRAKCNLFTHQCFSMDILVCVSCQPPHKCLRVRECMCILFTWFIVKFVFERIQNVRNIMTLI